MAGAVAGAWCAPTEQPAAETAAPPPPAPAEATPTLQLAPEAAEVAESTRSSVRAMAVWLARGVDSWFGDRPFEQGGRVTDGRLSTALLFRQHEKVDFDLRFNARFRLPNIEDKLYGFVGRDDRRDVIADRPGAFSRQDRLLWDDTRDQAFFVGLGRALSETVDLRLGLRGVRPFAQARYKTQWLIGPNDLADFRQTLFWTLDDRLGSTTVLSYEHAFTPELAARWLNSATITQETEVFEWATLLGGYRSFGDQQVLGLEAVANGVQGSGIGPSDYGLQLRWEQPVYEDWLLGGVLVGHFWPRKDEPSPRERAWALGVSLKMRF